MATSKGLYVTRGRGNELEREIRQVRLELGERVAAAEARAAAAEQRCNAIVEALTRAATRRES